MQSVSFRIWAHVTMSISYDDNHYTTGTSAKPYLTLSGTTTLGQRRSGKNSNEGALCIPQISKAGALPSNGLTSYPGHYGGGSYLTEEMPLVYSTAPLT